MGAYGDRTDVNKGTFEDVAVTIADSASASGVCDCGGMRVLGFRTDSAWDTNTVSFQVSNDNSTWFPLFNEQSNAAAEYTLTGVVASKAYGVNPAAFGAWRYVKVNSGINATPVTQSGATVVTLSLGIW